MLWILISFTNMWWSTAFLIVWGLSNQWVFVSFEFIFLKIRNNLISYIVIFINVINVHNYYYTSYYSDEKKFGNWRNFSMLCLRRIKLLYILQRKKLFRLINNGSSSMIRGQYYIVFYNQTSIFTHNLHSLKFPSIIGIVLEWWLEILFCYFCWHYTIKLVLVKSNTYKLCHIY